MMFLIDRFREIIERIDKQFEGSKFEPAWQTMSTFFFSEKTVTKMSGPHVRDNTDLKRYMTVVMAAAGPALLASIYFFGWRSLAMVVLSYTIGIVIELVFAIFKNEEVTEGMFVTCILFPLILPPMLPFWMAAVGIAVGIIIGKEIFGGTGKNIFNPAIVGRTFIAITFPVQMASQWVPPFKGGLGGFLHWSQSADVITTATPLGNFKNGMPDGLWDMFIGSTSGSFGETSAVLIIAGGLFLMATKVANWRLPAATISSAMVLAYLMNMSNPEQYASPIYHLLGGGFLFGAFFMVTDPVSAPFSSAGKWVYGILIGVVVIVIRNLSGFTEGMMFAILLLNMFAPVIDDAVLGIKYGRGK
jgi:Na+-transporting NADH:ubiquinone oxidoreductase subunit B